MSGAEQEDVRVHYVEDAGLALVTLADSARGNRINAARLAALHEAFGRAEASEAVRAIVLRSDGVRFCLGMDFSFFLGTEAGGLSAEEAVKAYSGLLTRMRVSSKPVIALVDGDVKAGGIGLIAAADIVIASERSQFQLSEVLLGLIPANVLPFLIERIGERRASWLTMTARTLGAEGAREIGLVDEVFATDALEKETRAFMRTIMRADPHALAATKSFISEIAGLERDAATEAAARSLLELAGRPEVRYAVAAFEDGGLPAWSLRFKPEHNLWMGEKTDE